MCWARSRIRMDSSPSMFNPGGVNFSKYELTDYGKVPLEESLDIDLPPKSCDRTD